MTQYKVSPKIILAEIVKQMVLLDVDLLDCRELVGNHIKSDYISFTTKEELELQIKAIVRDLYLSSKSQSKLIISVTDIVYYQVYNSPKISV